MPSTIIGSVASFVQSVVSARLSDGPHPGNGWGPGGVHGHGHGDGNGNSNRSERGDNHGHAHHADGQHGHDDDGPRTDPSNNNNAQRPSSSEGDHSGPDVLPPGLQRQLNAAVNAANQTLAGLAGEQGAQGAQGNGHQGHAEGAAQGRTATMAGQQASQAQPQVATSPGQANQASTAQQAVTTQAGAAGQAQRVGNEANLGAMARADATTLRPETAQPLRAEARGMERIAGIPLAAGIAGGATAAANSPSINPAQAMPPGNPMANPLANAASTPAGNPHATMSAQGASVAGAERATAYRNDVPLVPITTLDGPLRKRRRAGGSSDGAESWLQRLAGGYTLDDGIEAATQDTWFALRWLYWLLAIIAYACLGLALVAFLGPDGSQWLPSAGTGRVALWVGMFAAAGAFLLARRLLSR